MQTYSRSLLSSANLVVLWEVHCPLPGSCQEKFLICRVTTSWGGGIGVVSLGVRMPTDHSTFHLVSSFGHSGLALERRGGSAAEPSGAVRGGGPAGGHPGGLLPALSAVGSQPLARSPRGNRLCFSDPLHTTGPHMGRVCNDTPEFKML